MSDRSTDELAKILWNYNKLNCRLEKSDCIIVLGSHDTRVAERGARLLLESYAPLILFSGGFGRLTSIDRTKPEAETFAEVAVKMGVPRDQIIIENKSTNTGENIDYSLALLKEKGIIPSKIILVTKPYTERRAYATFKKRFPDIDVETSSPEISYEDYPNETISKEHMINIMVGDTQRIKLYPSRGFAIEQEIPDNVWQAYEELVKRCFTSQLINE